MAVYTPNSAWVDGPVGGTPLSAARLNNMEAGISATYTTYTPTWTATGTAPVVGNATVTARYIQCGKMVHAYGSLVFGTTSTYGTGSFRFALPVTCSATTVAANHLGTGLLYDTSANAEGLARAQIVTTTTFQMALGGTYLGTVTVAGQTVPWTWATGDQIHWNITYEAA